MGRGVPVRGASVRAPPAGDNLDALRDRWGLAFPFVVPLSEHRPRGDDLDALRDRWGVAFPFVVLPSEYRPRGDNLNASVRAWGRECTEGLHDGMRQGNTLRGSGASPARLQNDVAEQYVSGTWRRVRGQGRKAWACPERWDNEVWT